MGISTKNVNTLSLTTDNILQFISEEQIFRKYISKNFQIGEIFCAEYREDKSPSFGVFWSSSKNKLMFNDLGKKESGDCFKYVQLALKCDFFQALHQINKDFNLGLGGGNYKPDLIKTYQKVDKIAYLKERKKISIIKQDYTQRDIEYWGDYGISVETLKKYNVFSCQCFSIDGEVKRCYVDNYPIYAYFFPRTGNYKIYIPHEQDVFKWATNANNDWDVMGYDQLPKEGDLIYITKSMKDCMVLYELGITSVATHGEGQSFNPDFLRHIRKRFKRVIVFYDQDTAGRICGAKMASEFNLEEFYIPEREKCKDISDFVQQRGKTEGLKLMING